MQTVAFLVLGVVILIIAFVLGTAVFFLSKSAFTSSSSGTVVPTGSSHFKAPLPTTTAANTCDKIKDCDSSANICPNGSTCTDGTELTDYVDFYICMQEQCATTADQQGCIDAAQAAFMRKMTYTQGQADAMVTAGTIKSVSAAGLSSDEKSLLNNFLLTLAPTNRLMLEPSGTASPSDADFALVNLSLEEVLNRTTQNGTAHLIPALQYVNASADQTRVWLNHFVFDSSDAGSVVVPPARKMRRVCKPVFGDTALTERTTGDVFALSSCSLYRCKSNAKCASQAAYEPLGSCAALNSCWESESCPISPNPSWVPPDAKQMCLQPACQAPPP